MRCTSQNYFFTMLLIANITSKMGALTHSAGIRRLLFPSFEMEATPHQPLQSEKLPFYSKIGGFHVLKETQLRSCSKQKTLLNACKNKFCWVFKVIKKEYYEWDA